MKKEDLTALGISEELSEKVIALYNSSIDGSFIPKSRFNEVNEENKILKQSVAYRDNMNRKIILKIAADILMTAALPLLMC